MPLTVVHVEEAAHGDEDQESLSVTDDSGARWPELPHRCEHEKDRGFVPDE